MKQELRNLFLFMLLFTGQAGAQFVTPWYYSATGGEGKAQAGSYNYFDETGTQLTDNVLGTNNINADLGHGPAYEWVGWRWANPTITFYFSNVVTITSVQIGFANSAVSQIYLPSRVTVNGTRYYLSGNELPAETRGFVTFSGCWSGTSLTIELWDNSLARWIFVDEVRFIGQPGGFCADIYSAVEVCWNSQSNKLYQVEYQTALNPNQWFSVGPPVLATNAESCVLDSVRNSPKKLYRIREL